MQRTADGENIGTIAMPRIGAGYGGLSWKKVRVIVEEVFASWLAARGAGATLSDVYSSFVAAIGTL